MSRMELGEIKKAKVKPDKAKVKPDKAKVKKLKSGTSKDLAKPVKVKPKKLSLKKKKLKTSLTKSDLGSGKSLIEEGNALLERMSENIFDENRLYLDQYRHMFQKLADMSEIAEKQYFDKKQSRDIYALMKLYDQMREVIADLKALQNVGQYIDAVMGDVLEPYAKTSIQALLDLISSTNSYSKRNLDPDVSKLLEEQLKSFGKIAGLMLQEGYDAAVENTRRILEG